MKVRLQKVLADAGIASRRSSEAIILEGRVSVDGDIVTTLGTRVDPAVQRIQVDGTPVRPRKKLYVALHKPRRVVSTRSDPEQRRTVLDLLPPEWSNLYPVGRLDFESEGLLLLSNDGDFALRVTHPRYGVRKRYVATVEGRVEPDAAARLTRGVFWEGERLKAERARILRASNSSSTVELELREGKNREVRRLFSALGFEVMRLQRTEIGPIKLGELPSGKWRVLNAGEVRSLLSPPARHSRRRPAHSPARTPQAEVASPAGPPRSRGSARSPLPRSNRGSPRKPAASRGKITGPRRSR